MAKKKKEFINQLLMAFVVFMLFNLYNNNSKYYYNCYTREIV